MAGRVRPQACAFPRSVRARVADLHLILRAKCRSSSCAVCSSMSEATPNSAWPVVTARASVPMSRPRANGCPTPVWVPGVEARARYGWIRQITTGCVQRPAQRPVTWTDWLDRILTHKIWGTLVFLALMFLSLNRSSLGPTGHGPHQRGVDWLGDGLTQALPRPATSLLIEGILRASARSLSSCRRS